MNDSEKKKPPNNAIKILLFKFILAGPKGASGASRISKTVSNLDYLIFDFSYSIFKEP